MTIKFVPLTKDELGAIIICMDALLRGARSGSPFIINPKDTEREGYQQMLVHLESGCEKLLNMLESETPIFNPNNN